MKLLPLETVIKNTQTLEEFKGVKTPNGKYAKYFNAPSAEIDLEQVLGDNIVILLSFNEDEIRQALTEEKVVIFDFEPTKEQLIKSLEMFAELVGDVSANKLHYFDDEFRIPRKEKSIDINSLKDVVKARKKPKEYQKLDTKMYRN